MTFLKYFWNIPIPLGRAPRTWGTGCSTESKPLRWGLPMMGFERRVECAED